MKGIPFYTAVCLLPVFLACSTRAQSPDQAAAQQPLSKQVATACWNKRRLAIRAVNLKYIALTQDAANLFTKESNQPRADDANTWAKNLAWANDANLKGIATGVNDRLGVLQAAYLKERVAAIISADTACVDDVEAASKKASQGGDLASVTELAKQEDRIKQELRSVSAGNAPAHTVASVPAAPQAPQPAPADSAPLTAAGKAAADYNAIHTAAVKAVNQKYIALAGDAANLYLKENDSAKAGQSKDWAYRLQWTDGGNLLFMSPDTTDRLGVLQTAYLKERAAAVAAVDKACLDNVQAAQTLATRTGDQDGAKVLQQLLVEMNRELASAAPAPGQPAVASQPAAPLTPGEQVTADFNKARSDAVKTVNQNYARQALLVVDLFHSDGNASRADAAKDWATRLNWTDDVGNMRGLAPDVNDRLGALQKSYIKDRAGALVVVDNAWLEKVKTAQKTSTPDNDIKGTVALMQIMDIMSRELGIVAPPPMAAVPSTALTSNPAQTPPPQSAAQADNSHPFGVTADQFHPAATPPPQSAGQPNSHPFGVEAGQ